MLHPLLPKLRHGTRHAYLFSINLILNQSILKYVAGSAFSSYSSPDCCSSPRESVSVYANYRRSTFTISQQRLCVAKPSAICQRSTEPPTSMSLSLLSTLFSSVVNFLRLPQPILSYCCQPRQNRLPHAKTSPSLWHASFSSYLPSM